ncbi:uncharacterized protein LOC120334859 [Styela clava]
MEPRLKNLLFKTNTEYKDVRFSVYRTSLKLRRIQKSLKLDKIEVSSALAVLSQPLEGLSSSPEQSHPSISASGVQNVVHRVYTESPTQGNDLEEIFPEALADLTTALVMHIYDTKDEGIIPLQAVRSFFIVMCDRELIGKYKSLFWCHCEPGSKTLTKRNVAILLNHVIQITRVIFESSHFGKLGPAVESCFNGIFGYGITEHDFVRWMLLEPQSIVWLPTMHRINSAERSRHQVSCSICKTRPIIGLRFRCLRCMDYNACQNCFLTNTDGKKSHKPTHPVQEYCMPVKKRESMKDLARTFRNIVTKRYKRKTVSRSFLPIDQSGNNNGIMMETWQQQSLDVTSTSMPDIEYGRYTEQQNNGDLNVSRMSAGFADVSQLADEEKVKLDLLIEKLEEERRRMMATTELLESSQNNPQAGRIKGAEPQNEQEKLQAELEDIKHYNHDLQRELNELRASLHTDTHHRTQHVPQHTGVAPRTSTPRIVSQSPENASYSPKNSRYSPVATGSHYYTPEAVQSRKSHESLHYSPRHYDDSISKYDTPPDLQTTPPQFIQPPERVATSVIQRPGSHPHYEPLKGRSGHSPKLYPTKKDPEMKGLSPKASRRPMRVPRDEHHSLGYSPQSLEQDSPIGFHKKPFRSLGNSPRENANDIGSPLKPGPWGSRKVLPDVPFGRSLKHPRSSPSQSSQSSPQVAAAFNRPGLAQRSLTPTDFSRVSAKGMYNQFQKDSSSESGSFSDISQNSRHSSPKRQSWHSSRGTSPKLRRNDSQSLQEAYLRHLEANQTTSESMLTTSQHSHNLDSEEIRENQSTPTPKQRKKRSSTPQRKNLENQSHEPEIEYTSDASSKPSYKNSSKSPKIPQRRQRPQSYDGSLRSPEKEIPKPHRRGPSKMYGSQEFNGEKTPSFGDNLHNKSPFQDKLQLAPSFQDKLKRGHKNGSTNKSSSSESSQTSGSKTKERESGGGRPSSVSSRGKRIKNGEQRHLSRNNTQGSIVAPRKVVSCENLAYEGSQRGSMDSLDTLHGAGVSNPSLGIYGTSNGDTISPVPDTPGSSDHQIEHSEEIDPYAHIHSSKPNIVDRSEAEAKMGHSSQKFSTNRADFSPKNGHIHMQTGVQSPTGNSSKSRSFEGHSNARKTPEMRRQLEASGRSKPQKEKLDRSQRKDMKTKHKEDSSASGSDSDLQESTRATPKNSRKSSPKQSRARSQKVSSKPSTPKGSRRERTLTPQRKSHRKHEKNQTSDGGSTNSRSSPEGDFKSKSLENSSSDHSFTSPEEEMKFLVSRLQGIMPSTYDQSIDSRSSFDLKVAKPMNEVLLAAQQTRQSIRLFAEYAIAVAAGEV